MEKSEFSLAAKDVGEARVDHDTPMESTGPVPVQVIAADVVLSGWRLYIVQISLCFALFLGAIDSSIVATALVTIGKHFNDLVRLQWVVLAYLLTFLGFALIFSRISDVLGRKWTCVVAITLLASGSLGAGLSQSLTQLIAFRALQGLGGSGVYAVPFTVLPEITPVEKLPLMSGIAGITFICSAVLGPTLGGIITTQSTWRWIFLFNVPCAALVIAMILIAWPSRHRAAGKIPWRQFDIIGCLLCIATSVLLVFALQQGGAGIYAWSSPVIIASLTVAGAAAVALCFWIWYLSTGKRIFAPLFPGRVVLHRVLATNFMISILTGYVLYSVVVELSQRYQVVNAKSPQSAGISMLPLLGASAFASGVGGWLSSKRNRTFYVVTGASAIGMVGCALLSTVGPGENVPHRLYGYQVILGSGLGGCLVTTIVIIKLNASEEDAAAAQGLESQSRLVGGNLGLSIATVILNSRLSSDLINVLTPQQISDLRGSLNTIETLTPTQVAAVAISFADAFKRQMQVCTGIMAASFLLCLLTWQRNPPTFAELEEKKLAARKETVEVGTGEA